MSFRRKSVLVGVAAVAVSFGPIPANAKTVPDPIGTATTTPFDPPIPGHIYYQTSPVIGSPQCSPEDEEKLDLDGDRLIGYEEDYPNNPLIASKPELTVEIIGDLHAYLDYKIVETNQFETLEEVISEQEREEVSLSSYASEIKSHYSERYSNEVGLSLGVSIQELINLDFGKAFEGSFSYSSSASLESSFQQTKTWRLEESARHRLNMAARDLKRRRYTGEISLEGQNAGRISGFVRVTNNGTRPLTLNVSDLRINIAAVHPLTGDIQFAMQAQQGGLLPQSITIPYLSYEDIAIPPTEVPTTKMLSWLEHGYVFSAWLAGLPTLSSPTNPSLDIAELYTGINANTAKVAIKYGHKGEVCHDFSRPHHEYIDASVYRSESACEEKTIRELLEDSIVIYDHNIKEWVTDIEFDTSPSGETYVSRVRTQHAIHENQNFDDLNDQDRCEFQKWIVGFHPGPFNQHVQDWHFDKTIVRPGDRVYLYRLTRMDLERPKDWESPPIDPLADDVGVISGSSSCPAGTKKISMYIDAEDDDPKHGETKGWTGSIKNEKGSDNYKLTICRVDGARFGPTVYSPYGTSDVAKYGYAVLKLDQYCPYGSAEYQFIQDTEDKGGKKNLDKFHGAGAYGAQVELLSKHKNSIRWRLCVFGYTLYPDEEVMDVFPDLGGDYGVFASPAFEGPGGTYLNWSRGSALMDDEEDSNKTGVEVQAPVEVRDVVNESFYKTNGQNTMMKLIRVQ